MEKKVKAGLGKGPSGLSLRVSGQKEGRRKGPFRAVGQVQRGRGEATDEGQEGPSLSLPGPAAPPVSPVTATMSSGLSLQVLLHLIGESLAPTGK